MWTKATQLSVRGQAFSDLSTCSLALSQPTSEKLWWESRLTRTQLPVLLPVNSTVNAAYSFICCSPQIFLSGLTNSILKQNPGPTLQLRCQTDVCVPLSLSAIAHQHVRDPETSSLFHLCVKDRFLENEGMSHRPRTPVAVPGTRKESDNCSTSQRI